MADTPFLLALTGANRALFVLTLRDRVPEVADARDRVRARPAGGLDLRRR